MFNFHPNPKVLVSISKIIVQSKFSFNINCNGQHSGQKYAWKIWVSNNVWCEAKALQVNLKNVFSQVNLKNRCGDE